MADSLPKLTSKTTYLPSGVISNPGRTLRKIAKVVKDNNNNNGASNAWPTTRADSYTSMRLAEELREESTLLPRGLELPGDWVDFELEEDPGRDAIEAVEGLMELTTDKRDTVDAMVLALERDMELSMARLDDEEEEIDDKDFFWDDWTLTGEMYEASRLLRAVWVVLEANVAEMAYWLQGRRSDS